MNDSALVLLSGGQDSTTCLFWALREFKDVRALTINYGQRHDAELRAADKVAQIAGVEHTRIDVPEVLRGMSPLVNRKERVEEYTSAETLPGGLEKTFVPARNALFLVLAANVAYCEQTPNIVIGVSQEDYGGYPDCRDSFISSMELSLRLALHHEDAPFKVQIRVPLIYKSKASTVLLAQSLGPDCWSALSYSHTCYKGEVPPCGVCHACLLRAKGFRLAGVMDPLLDRDHN